MSSPASHTAVLPLCAPREELCLDFANTLSWRGSDAPAESLDGFDALVDWLDNAGCAVAPDIGAWARAHPKRTARLFTAAIALRETIFRCAAAIAADAAVPAADLAALNEALAAAPPRRRLMQVHVTYAWQITIPAPSAPALLAPVLWSAADLLVSAGHLRVRCCTNPRCLWLFIDRSKTGTRRWCEMASCGNRAKAMRHYRRKAGGEI